MAAAATEPASGDARPITWCAAGLAVASVPLHGWMLAVHSHGLVLTVLMAAMALWCLWCAVGVVRRANRRRPDVACPRTRALRHLWVMAGVMALLHVALLTGPFGGSHHGDHGPGTGRVADAAAALEPGASAGPALMLAIVILEVAVCFACAAALRTRHVPRCPGFPGPSATATVR